MSQPEVIIFLLQALALIGGAFYFHVRVRNLESQLLISEEGNIDAEIVSKTHALSDADLDAKFKAALGGDKLPP